MAKWKQSAHSAAQAKRRKAFGRAVAAGRGKAREVKDANLRARNAYRAAAGLPLLPA